MRDQMQYMQHMQAGCQRGTHPPCTHTHAPHSVQAIHGIAASTRTSRHTHVPQVSEGHSPCCRRPTGHSLSITAQPCMHAAPLTQARSWATGYRNHLAHRNTPAHYSCSMHNGSAMHRRSGAMRAMMRGKVATQHLANARARWPIRLYAILVNTSRLLAVDKCASDTDAMTCCEHWS